MCGINGFYSKHRPTDQVLDSVRRMNLKISHRGPDAGLELMHTELGLGHRRLSILDLRPEANQPMFSQDRRYSVVFNGEIYNYLQLKHELELLGERFKTTSDTEVLLAACIRWGTGAFSRLNGIFAFAFFDSIEKELYLVRDRFGIKPLFFSRKSDELAFSSSLVSLLEVPFVQRKIDNSNIFHYLKHGHVPCPQTLIEGVEQMPPRTYARLNLRSGEWEQKEYCKIERVGAQINDETQALEQVDLSLRQAVQRQLMADVPLGILLSGGVDSSLITAAFREVSNQAVDTYCIGYNEAEFDESSYAEQVARHFKTNHHTLRVSAGQLFDLIPQVPRFFDQPFSDPTLLSTMILCREARKKITVALGGDGGDELFFGYSYQPVVLKLLSLLWVPGWTRKLAAHLGRLLLDSQFYLRHNLKLQQVKKFLEILTFNNKEELYMYFIGTIGPMEMGNLKKLLVQPPQDHTIHYHKYLESHHSLTDFQSVERLFMDTFLVDTVNQKSDRASMAYGLELRVPFLDDDLVNLSLRLSPDLKYRNGIKKYILRRLLEKKMPGLISQRPKQGFSIPMRDWLRGDLAYLLKEQLSTEALKNDDYFNAAEIQVLIKQHLSSTANHSHLLWSLVVFQLWRREHRLN
jgi:asparagine synthase (glutamine-hydrolysing)